MTQMKAIRCRISGHARRAAGWCSDNATHWADSGCPKRDYLRVVPYHASPYADHGCVHLGRPYSVNTPTLTPGARYYLDATTAGALATEPPDDAVKIGIAQSPDILFVDIDAAGTANARTLALPCSYSAGLQMSNGGDTSHDIDIAQGVCRDSADALNITLPAITKRIDATWVATSGAGGLANGTALTSNT